MIFLFVCFFLIFFKRFVENSCAQDMYIYKFTGKVHATYAQQVLSFCRHLGKIVYNRSIDGCGM